LANQQILCTVNSCFYYGSGDKCKAEKIMVKNNETTLRDTRMEIGSIGGEASNSCQTLCHTFIPKEQGPKPGIARMD
jgi:hypothetical protein